MRNLRFKTKTNWIILFLLLVNVQLSFAQISLYDFTQEYLLASDTETPELVFSSSVNIVPDQTIYDKAFQRLFIKPNTMVTGGSGADGEGLPIGFNFVFDGNTFDRFAISSNGYIRLGKSGENFTILNDTIAGSIFNSEFSDKKTNIISVCQTNSSVMSKGNYVGVRYETHGFPGERQLVVEFQMSSGQFVPGFIWIYRIILDETSNKIRFVLPKFLYNSGVSMPVAVGLRGGQLTNDMSNLAIRKVTKGEDINWTNSRAATSASDLCDMTKNFCPLSSEIPPMYTVYTWTPPVANITKPLCNFIYFRDSNPPLIPAYYNAYYTMSQNGTDISVTPAFEWIENNDPANTYDIYLCTDNPPTDKVATGLTSQLYPIINSTKKIRVVKYQMSQLAPNTVYHYKIVQMSNGQKIDSCQGKFTTTKNPQYCIPKGYLGGNGIIGNVSFNTLNYYSPGMIPPNNRDLPGEIFTFPETGAYTTSLKRGISYNFSIKLLAAAVSKSLGSAFIDFNQDGDFNDANERIDMNDITPGVITTLAFPVPIDAVLGKTRLRILIRTFYKPAINPCDQVNDISAAQDYTITVLPAPGCETFTLNTVTSDVSCFNGNDGSIYLTASGGAEPYVFSWMDEDHASEHRTDLGRGIYQASATDANGCLVTTPFMPVLQPSVISIDTHTSDDKITALVVSGGTPPYSYLWSDGSTTSDWDALAPGVYSLTVTDSHECQATKNNIHVETITGLTERKELKVELYPNPTSSLLYVKSEEDRLIIQVVTAEGIVVKENTGGLEPIDLQDLSFGLYFVKVSNGKSLNVMKLIKE